MLTLWKERNREKLRWFYAVAGPKNASAREQAN